MWGVWLLFQPRLGPRESIDQGVYRRPIDSQRLSPG